MLWLFSNPARAFGLKVKKWRSNNEGCIRTPPVAPNFVTMSRMCCWSCRPVRCLAISRHETERRINLQWAMRTLTLISTGRSDSSSVSCRIIARHRHWAAAPATHSRHGNEVWATGGGSMQPSLLLRHFSLQSERGRAGWKQPKHFMPRVRASKS